MRLRTVATGVLLLALLGGAVAFGLGTAPAGGSLSEAWVSDTPRDNVRNHHPIGVGPNGSVIVAPVSEIPGSGVELTNHSCTLVRLAPENGSVLWRTTTPASQCFSHALTQPTVDDVDGDGRLEVVVTSTENAVIVYDARTGTEEWRVPLSTYGYPQPTVADVLPAPGPEVVASDIQGSVVVAYGNGTVAWQHSLNRTFGGRVSVLQAPVVADVDADGSPNVLVSSDDGTVVLSATGDVVWTSDVPGPYLATGNADDDPAVEVVTAYYRSIQALDGKSGRIEWRRNLTNARIHTVADGDGDGTEEVYLGRVGGEILALNAHTGTTEWTTTVSTVDDAIVPPPVLADVDGDGGPEVVGATETGRVVVLSADSGAELASYERDVTIWTFVTTADIDDDGRSEILVRYGDGRVVALQYRP